MTMANDYKPMTREDHVTLMRAVVRAKAAYHAAKDEAAPGIVSVVELPLDDLLYLVRGASFCALMTAQLFEGDTDQ